MCPSELRGSGSDRPGEHDQPQESTELLRSHGRDYLANPLTPQEIERENKVFRGELRWNPSEHRWVEGMPDAEHALVDSRKFGAYSMNPGNENNQGKHKAWEQLGYNVADEQTRTELSAWMTRMVEFRVQTAEVAKQWDAPNGRKYRIPLEVDGPSGSDRKGTLQTVWLREPDAEAPRLITNWLEVHKEKESEQAR